MNSKFEEKLNFFSSILKLLRAQAIEKLAKKNPEPSIFLPKKTLTVNGKQEKNKKFEYFEDLFYTTLKMQPHLTEEMKFNHFYAHLRRLALKTFKNIQRTSTTTLEDILVVFRRKYVKRESSASAKHRFYRLMFQPEKSASPSKQVHKSSVPQKGYIQTVCTTLRTRNGAQWTRSR